MSGRLGEILTSVDVMRCAIVATLSSFESGVEFGRDLREQIKNLYGEIFEKFTKDYQFSGEKVKGLINHVFLCEGFSNSIGLTNWSPSFYYKIEPKLHKLSDISKEILGEEDFNYFAELGKQLIPR